MEETQIVAGALLGVTARCRAAMTIRRTAFLIGAISMIAGTALITAGSALAGVGSEPGHLSFSPASGATTLTPTWSTSDACPAGYQGSAQMAIFNVSSTLLSSISNVAYNVNRPFSGELDGNMRAILKFAHVTNGGSLEFTVGCYSQEGGTGKFTWMQSSLVTLSSDGKSYSTSAPSGQWAVSASNQAKGPLAGPNAGAQGHGSAANAASASTTADQAGGGIGAFAIALIAAACALAVGTAGYVLYRRRDRSRLM
jgi:hypothetical protein